MGGDGMQVQIDNRNTDIIYTGSQFGVYYRLNNKTGKRTYIKPKHDLGESPLRFNWQTPILLSPHNQDILYLGSNKLHASYDKGDNWSFKTKDLTKGIKKGNVPYGTITSIDESVFKFGKLITGSDDGLVQLSNDGGNTWNIISDDLPQHLWVSRVVLSRHQENTIYVTLNGYRYDDFNPYIYVSKNDGESWKRIDNNLPKSSVNVIKEDPYYENIIYLGTDNGAYISLNYGTDWSPFQNGLQKVAVHDLVIQKEHKDLLLATHGRSIYKMNLSVIYSYLEKIKSNNESHYIFIDNIKSSNSWGKRNYNWSEYKSPVEKSVVYSNMSQKTNINLRTNSGKLIYNKEIVLEKGFQYLKLPLEFLESFVNKKNKKYFIQSENGKFYLKKGEYKLEIGKVSEGFEIK
jgi:hypothetical protein